MLNFAGQGLNVTLDTNVSICLAGKSAHLALRNHKNIVFLWSSRLLSKGDIRILPIEKYVSARKLRSIDRVSFLADSFGLQNFDFVTWHKIVFDKNKFDDSLHYFVQYDLISHCILHAVRSSLDYPLIDRCEQEGRICLVLSSHANLSCFVTNSRPAAKLTWWMKTRGHVSNISASSLIVDGAHWLTSYANITFPLPRNSPFMLFVCKVARIPPLLPLSESMVLVDDVSFSPFSNGSDHILAAQETMVFINCSDTQPIYMIWKYQVHSNEYRKLGYFTSEGGLFSKTYSEKVQITGNNGALIIYNVLASDEGVYVCSYDTDSERGIKVYNITVYGKSLRETLICKCCSLLTCKT